MVSGPIVEGIVSGMLGAAMAGAAMWIQQHNRHRDKYDSDLLREAASRSSDTRAALDAWQHIVAAHTKEIAEQRAEIATLRQRAEDCEEAHRTLLEEVAKLREAAERVPRP